MIVTLPAEIPVSKPLGLIVAILWSLDDQLAAVPVALSWILDPEQTEVAPVIIGNAITFIVVLFEHPSEFV